MNKRRIYLVVFILVLLSMISSSVYAQNMLDTVLNPFEKINIGATYEKHWYIVDCIMYFIILVGVAQFVFSKQFEGKGGKAIIIGVGVSLAVAASYFEYKQNFHLLEVFGPIAVIAVILVFLVGIYKFAQAMGAGGKGFAMLAFSFLFFYIAGQMPHLTKWFANNPSEYIRLIWALLNLLAIVFLIWGIISLISGLAGLGGEGGKGGFWNNLFGNKGDRGGKGGGRDKGGGGGEGPGGEGEGKEKEEEKFDFENPATITVLVTDVDNEPIKGATVIITGPKSGWPRHFPGWRWSWRGPYYTGKTGPDGRIPAIRVPAGNLRFEARHPGYRFLDFLREGKRYSTTYWIVHPNEEIEIHMRLRREEMFPEPVIMGIIPPEQGGYRFAGKIINERRQR